MLITALSCLEVRANHDGEEPNDNCAGFVAYAELIVVPDKYHGCEIVVTGVMDFHIETATLYPSMEYYNAKVFSSSIGMTLPRNWPIEKYEEMLEFEGKYIRVRGVFDAEDTGQFGFVKGTIVDITEITLHSRPM